MALTEDLKAAIEKNLSAEVGASLKTRLAQAEEDAKALVENRKFVEALKNQVDGLQKQVKSQEEVEGRIRTANEAERKLLGATALKEIVDLKLEFAKERVADMKHLVALVFQNNQYKYTLTDNGNTPIPTGQGSYYPATHSRTITGQGEGAPPPPPGSGP